MTLALALAQEDREAEGASVSPFAFSQRYAGEPDFPLEATKIRLAGSPKILLYKAEFRELQCRDRNSRESTINYR
jgi:hypothetical protein